jgi:hypothetical protein
MTSVKVHLELVAAARAARAVHAFELGDDFDLGLVGEVRIHQRGLSHAVNVASMRSSMYAT